MGIQTSSHPLDFGASNKRPLWAYSPHTLYSPQPTSDAAPHGPSIGVVPLGSPTLHDVCPVTTALRLDRSFSLPNNDIDLQKLDKLTTQRTLPTLQIVSSPPIVQSRKKLTSNAPKKSKSLSGKMVQDYAASLFENLL